ncbi:UNVERIFIED_CONTAM: hypothetical protein NCL1_45803 [Trichonephila clavipes]
MMNIFEPCTLQIGDRNYLIMKDSYDVISLREWKNRISSRLSADVNSLQIKSKSIKGTESTKSEDECNDNSEKEDGQNNVKDNSDFDDEDSLKSSDASSVTSHSTTSSVENAANLTKKKKAPHYATKMKRKMKSVRRRAMRHVMKEALPLKHGAKLVTEALVTETKAHVVWQMMTAQVTAVMQVCFLQCSYEQCHLALTENISDYGLLCKFEFL